MIYTMKKMYLILLGMLTLTLSTFGQGKTPQSINIINYNIRLNTTADGENAWPLRKDKVTGLLRFHKADIFNVQEALPEQMDDLSAAFPEFDHVGVGRDDGARKGEYVAIYYKRERFEKITDGMFWLSLTPNKPGLGWDAACNRTVTWIKLKDKTSNKTFYVFDTHFDHKGKTAQEESAKLILKAIKDINKENLPLILTGDFNLVKSSAPIQLILKEMDDALDTSKTPPYGSAGTSGGFEVKVMPNKIDFIFITKKVSVLRHGILSDSFGLFYPSDHLPVLAEIQLID